MTYTVVISAKNPDLKLNPGLTATISIYTLELKDVLTTEAKAINFKPNTEILTAYNLEHDLPDNTNKYIEASTTIWVLNSNGAILPKTVTLGASDGVHVQIVDGLTAGEKLVYSLKSVNKSEIKTDDTNKSPFSQQGGRPGRI